MMIIDRSVGGRKFADRAERTRWVFSPADRHSLSYISLPENVSGFSKWLFSLKMRTTVARPIIRSNWGLLWLCANRVFMGGCMWERIPLSARVTMGECVSDPWSANCFWNSLRGPWPVSVKHSVKGSWYGSESA